MLDPTPTRPTDDTDETPDQERPPETDETTDTPDPGPKINDHEEERVQPEAPAEVEDPRFRLDSWLAFHPNGRPSIIQVGKIVSRVDDETLVVHVPANPEQLQEIATREKVSVRNVDYYFPPGDPEPRNLTKVDGGFETQPWFDDNSQPRFLDHATIVNHPEGNDDSQLDDMWVGNNLVFRLANRMPTRSVVLTIEDVVDVHRVKRWLVGPSTRMLQSPRIFCSPGSPARSLRDSRMDPERIAFSGRWTMVQA